MSLNHDLTELFSKHYNKPEHKEEALFKSRYISVENIAQNILKTDIKRGLNTADKNDIEWRKKTFGTNDYFISAEETSFFGFLCLSFEDPITLMIFVISILLIVIDILNYGIKSGYQEGLSIIVCLLIYLSLNAYKDYNTKNKIVEYDKIKSEKKCKVIRNNKEEIISNRDILVGDILSLNKGDIVEVDGLFTQEKMIGVDESPIITVENKYKIKYKSNNFKYDKEKNNYICPFIFAGTYIVEGEGYMLVTAVGNNLYKNDKMINELTAEKMEYINKQRDFSENQNIEINAYEDEIDEYINDYGCYKILTSALSEQISSLGVSFYVLLGFIWIIKKTVINLKNGKSFLALDEADVIINGILLALLGSIFSMINSLFSVDLIGFLSDLIKMKKNNIIFGGEKYSELAFIDTLILLDNKKPLIPGDDKNIETSKIMQQIQYSGINIIFLSEDNIDNSIVTAKKLGIIEDYEIEKGKKCLKKYTNLVKENLLVIEDKPILLEGNIFYSLCGDIKKETSKNGNEKITISNIDNFKKVISDLKIISNIRKEDKLVLFNGLKQIGIFAVTGVSIDDLRLLKISKFSFGNNNDYDIFKENYSLTLLDNSLNTFWKAYIYSTNLIYKIVQYIKFYISTFTSILLINAIGLIFFRDIPINLIPIIFIICVIDIASPPGIVGGNNCNKLLTREKYYKNVPFISNKALLDIILHVISTIIIIVYLMIKGNNLFNVESDKLLEHNIWNETNGYHVTIIYCIVFFMILIHLALIVIETNNNFIQFGLNICILVLIQIWIVNSGGKIARTKPLSQNDLLKCFGIASLTIPVHLISKIIKF